MAKMRILTGILSGSAVSIITFSALWSGFVVRHHSYGGDSRLSQFGGTLFYFSVYLLPILIVALSIFVSLTEFVLIKKEKVSAVVWWRLLTWSAVTVGVLAGITSFAAPELGFASLVCGVIAAISGALVYERIASGVPKIKPAGTSSGCRPHGE